MIKVLDRKLLRDIWRLKGQVVSIATVIASGVALLVMSLTTHEALRVSADTYYDHYRFGHVFAGVKRAPLHLKERILSLAGVQSASLRISMQAVVDVAEFPEPLMARLVSLPEGQQPTLNRLALKSGRLVEAGRPDEVVVNVSFAEAHGLKPGDTLQAIINGTKRELQIVGTAMSPEFIYVISPFALIPDKKRYGILWMGRQALESAYDYAGAFNELAITVFRGTDTRKTIQELDVLLGPYGSTGAIDRKDHLSAWFVENELRQNETSARILPTIFLLVAAFLINTVLARLIATERGEIGLMKAFGYSNREVGWHYAKLVITITAIGVVFGWALGAALGQFSTYRYAEVLNFPFLIYRPGVSSFVIGALVSVAVGLLATARSVRDAARLPPIVAMQPPSPPTFRRREGRLQAFAALLDEPTRIIIRQIARWPLRAGLIMLGFAGAVALMVLSLQFTDAVDEIARSQFGESQREDVSLGFNNPKSSTILKDIEQLPGIMLVEPMRIVPAELVSRHIKHRGALQGLVEAAQLTQIFDVKRGPLALPPSGLVLSSRLAEKLRVRVGDAVEVHVLEGRRPVRQIEVADVYDSYIGMFAYMNIDELNRMLGDRPSVEYVNGLVDESQQNKLLDKLKNLPAVSTVSLKSVAVTNFNETIAATLMIFVGFFGAFSFALGFGVTYNAQRIALSERGRELATLRVLGFSKGEVLYILLGEAMLLVCVALPFGCLFGWGLTALFVNASGFQTELMRLPLIIAPSTYGLAVAVLLVASAVSGVMMKRRVDQLDLVSVLKTRE